MLSRMDRERGVVAVARRGHKKRYDGVTGTETFIYNKNFRRNDL